MSAQPNVYSALDWIRATTSNDIAVMMRANLQRSNPLKITYQLDVAGEDPPKAFQTSLKQPLDFGVYLPLVHYSRSYSQGSFRLLRTGVTRLIGNSFPRLELPGGVALR